MNQKEARFKKWWTRNYNLWWPVVTGGLLICLIRFWPFFWSGQTLFFGDNYSLQVPGKIFTANWLKKGILPLWNPTLLGGISWIGEVNQSVLYPSTLLFVVFSPALALSFALLGHLMFTYVGAYLVGQKVTQSRMASLLAASWWTLSTQITGSLNNLSTIQSLAWLPWVVVGCWQLLDRVRTQKNWSAAAGWLAVMVTFQFAGGYPQHVLYSLLTGVVLATAANWRQIRWPDWLMVWLKTGLLTVSLAAVIWLPFVADLVRSTRMGQTIDQATSGSLSPVMLIKVLIPHFFDRPTAGYKWGPAWSGQANVVFYLGWFGWLAIGQWFKKRLGTRFTTLSFKKILARIGQSFTSTQWGLLLLTSGSLLLALGKYLPGYSWLQSWLPILHAGRYPSMALIVTNFCLALGAALAVKELRTNWQISKKWQVIGGLALVAGLSGWLSTVVAGGHFFAQFWTMADTWLGGRLTTSQFHTLARDQIISQYVSLSLIMSSVAFLISNWCWQRKQNYWLGVVVAVDLWLATQPLIFFAPARVYDQADLSWFKETIGEARFLTRNSNAAYTDFGTYWEALVVRQPFSDSFIDQTELNRQAVLQRLRDGATPDWQMTADLNLINGYTALLPADFAKIWQKDATAPGINFIDRIDLKSATDRQLLADWAVEYYLVDSWFEVKEDLSDLIPVAGSGDLTLYELSAQPRVRIESAASSPETKIISQDLSSNPNRLELVINNQSSAANLIIADRYDAGWQAKINGQAVPVKAVNGQRELALSPGINRIELIYRPRWFYWGLGITVITAGWWWGARKLIAGGKRTPQS